MSAGNSSSNSFYAVINGEFLVNKNDVITGDYIDVYSLDLAVFYPFKGAN